LPDERLEKNIPEIFRRCKYIPENTLSGKQIHTHISGKQQKYIPENTIIL